MNSSKKNWAKTFLLVFLLLSTFVTNLSSQTTNLQISRYYLLIKENIAQLSDSRIPQIEKEFFRFFFDRITELKNISIVNSKKTIIKLADYDSANYKIPIGIANAESLGKEYLSNCYLTWKLSSNFLEVTISAQEIRQVLASAALIVPSEEMLRSFMLKMTVDNLVNQLLGQKIEKSSKNYERKQKSIPESYNRKENDMLYSRDILTTHTNLNFKCFLLIETSFTFKYIPIFSKLTGKEKDFFKILFDSISTNDKIELVNSGNVIRRLGGYNPTSNIIPENLINSDFIGSEELANYLLEWSYKNDTLNVNILKKDNNKKKLTWEGLVLLPLEDKTSSHQNFLESFVSDIIRQLQKNKI